MSVKKAIQSFLAKETPFGRRGEQYEAIFIPKGKLKRLVVALQYLINNDVLKYPNCQRSQIVSTLLSQLERKLKAAGFKPALRKDSTKKLVVYVRQRE